MDEVAGIPSRGAFMESSMGPRARRRAVRAGRLDLSIQAVIFCAPLGDKPLRVKSIAELGAALEVSPETRIPQLGQTLDGTIQVGDEPLVPVRLRVVYVLRGRMGVEFLSPSLPLRNLIQKQFDAELSGASMHLTEAPPDESSREHRLKFSGITRNSLEIHVADGEIAEFIVAYDQLKEVISWSQRTPILENQPVEYETEIKKITLLRLIQNIDALDTRYKRKLEAIIHTCL